MPKLQLSPEQEREQVAAQKALEARRDSIVRTYDYATLAEYFEEQARLFPGRVHPLRDTHIKMAERHGVREHTIWRIANGYEASFSLAMAISKEKRVALDGFAVGQPKPAKKTTRAKTKAAKKTSRRTAA